MDFKLVVCVQVKYRNQKNQRQRVWKRFSLEENISLRGDI